MAVIMTVDGGGSRCRLAAFDEAGGELARITVNEHASLSLGVTQAWQHVEQGMVQMRQVLQLAADWLPDKLVLGLAGSLQESRRREFLSLMPGSLDCTLVTDGHAQLMGASGGRPGVCLAIGTGSVLHWLDDQGKPGMVGGWGFPAGDEASGAWFGLRLVQCYLWHFDGKRHESTLMKVAEERIGNNISSIQQWSTQCRSGELATLAPLVFEHAAQGDELALSILQEAAEHALSLVSLAPENLPVYIVGGVGEQLRELLVERLGSRVAAAQGDALRGLWQLSRISEKGETT
ncbi:BadF/BadG/BcrA/BcrD ATPase family protein [Granulosicoccus antarcticus]|uniref:Glucosamine kinase GspK n=1 Tax=Granulosicoccus antarcticus IMCC3135 TaxID=1192854 RepID=A0A2Z2NKH7_9GAMM|nr:BadF/BadG/BcrA/BcrD ATPase family protein [Granulosicoccus antarcticus]ASJ70388.1 Glucosamine kinase GspK [Granulosicoccus antarcticus IMCC3135]